ncbi:MAG: MFS transporter [Rhodospirillales bacterium]
MSPRIDGAAERAAERRRFVILAASVWLLLVTAGGMYLIVVALKEVAQEFGWPRAVPSAAFSLQFIGSGFGGLLMGWVLDRWGYGVPALVGTLMIAFGAMLVSLIDSEWQLYLIYGIMFGLAGQGSLAAPGMANIARWYTRRRGMAVGMVASGQALAGIVWPPIFGHLMEAVGWRAMFVWYGVFALSVLLPVCWVLRRKPPAEFVPAPLTADGTAARPAPPPPRAAMAPTALTVALSFAIFGCCVAMSLPLGHLVAYVTDRGHGIASAVEVLAAALLAAFLSRAVAVGMLSDRFGGLRALFLFSVLQAASLFTLTFMHDLVALYVVAALFGFGYGGIFPVYAVAIREHMPLPQVGRRTGLVFMYGAFAMGFGSWMGGWLFDVTGAYTLPFLIGVAFNLGNLVIVSLLILRLGLLRGRPAPA